MNEDSPGKSYDLLHPRAKRLNSMSFHSVVVDIPNRNFSKGVEKTRFHSPSRVMVK